MLRSLTCVYCDMCEIRVNVQVKGAAIAHLCRKSENVSMYGVMLRISVSNTFTSRLPKLMLSQLSELGPGRCCNGNW